MVFSGVIRLYRCKNCGNRFSDTIPTSIIPLLIALTFSFVLWASALGILFPIGKLAFIPGIILSLSIYLASYLILDRLMNKNLAAGVCPECGGELRPEQSGFYDGGRPCRFELSLYLITMIIASAAYFFASYL
jgi:hypothetical protein